MPFQYYFTEVSAESISQAETKDFSRYSGLKYLLMKESLQ